ncbi:MAG TPA: glycosyltransferase, partial [Thermoanaerobaculia bacterium]|nr:glycosyltransferase [Thermoanaerobaculia bacterium]
MTDVGRRLRLAISLLRAEGPRALLGRAADRLEEWNDRRRFLPAGGTVGPVPIVNLLGTAPAPRLGGVQTQLLRRLGGEAKVRPVALLYPEGPGLRLDVEKDGRRRRVRVPAGNPGPRPNLRDDAFERGVRELMRLSGACAIHVENPAGLPAASLARLAQSWPMVVSVHDFSPICPRTDLLERPVLAFCRYCDDADRCARCLGSAPAFVAGHRRASRALLAAARAAIFPSRFLLAALAERVPGLDPDRLHVIAPDPPPPSRRREPTPAVRHVAFVGAVTPQKGSRVFSDLVRALAPGFPGVRWSALGKGDPVELARLRRQGGIRVRGYYRAGGLPAVLERERVDLALALSVTPESYNLAVDECLAAGVPVLAFDHGAAADRLRA